MTHSVSTITTSFIHSLVSDFRHILKDNSSVLRLYEQKDQLSLLQAVLVNNPKFEIDTQCISLFGFKVPLKCMNQETLTYLLQLIVFQNKRGTLFKERITLVYTMLFSHFTLDSHIKTVVDRAQLALCIILHFKLNRLIVREFLIALQVSYSTDPLLLRGINVLLT